MNTRNKGPRLLVHIVPMDGFGSVSYRFQKRVLQVLLRMTAVRGDQFLNGVPLTLLGRIDVATGTADVSWDLRPQYDANGVPLWYDLDWSFVMQSGLIGTITYTDYDPNDPGRG